jgi:hypothetical protein
VFVATAVALATSAVVDSVEAAVEVAVEEEVCVAAIRADGPKLRYVSEGAETLKDEYISSRTELPISGSGFSASLRGNVHKLIFPPLTHSSLGRLSVGGLWVHAQDLTDLPLMHLHPFRSSAVEQALVTSLSSPTFPWFQQPPPTTASQQ